MTKKHYDVIVVGGGISGAALFFELAKYTDITKIALVEKYEKLSKLNSAGTSNSQTIHFGDIETNYTLEKAKKVKETASMVVKYGLRYGLEGKHLFAHQKMAIGVGEKEVEYMIKRHEEFQELYPYMEVFDKAKLSLIEPKLIYDAQGKERPEDVVGVGVQSGEYSTMDFGAMSESLVAEAQKVEGKTTDVYFNAQVTSITKLGDVHVVMTKEHTFTADFVVVNAGAHSLYLAHQMGYGLDFACLPVAGSFYLSTKKILNGKVYMVQNPKLPFAALHGDPDIIANGNTRFGPTALVLPKLERYVNGTYMDFLKTLQLDSKVITVFYDLLKDSEIRNYIFRNFFFEVPKYGKELFIKDARKIVPSLQLEDIEYAKNFGGVRPQVINKKEQKLMLGEASINPGTGIVFNMTPSPGATSCLGNARRDTRLVCEYLGKHFDEDMFNAELVE